MSDFNRMVDRFTIKESDKIKKICAPLSQQFGVKHFWYSETTSGGGYFSLASNPEMHEYYHYSNFHLHSPFFHNPEYIQPGFYFYDSIKDQKFQETFDTCSNKLKISFGGSLVVKKGTTMLRFGYAFDTLLGRSATNCIVNNFPVLQKFNEYFVEEAKQLIKMARAELVDLPTEMGATYHQAPFGLENCVSQKEKCAFFDCLGILNAKDVNKLTQREIKILECIHEGLSARLIGSRLQISPRTVEQHIESIKNKLSCFTKAELCHKANLLHAAGFF